MTLINANRNGIDGEEMSESEKCPWHIRIDMEVRKQAKELLRRVDELHHIAEDLKTFTARSEAGLDQKNCGFNEHQQRVLGSYYDVRKALKAIAGGDRSLSITPMSLEDAIGDIEAAIHDPTVPFGEQLTVDLGRFAESHGFQELIKKQRQIEASLHKVEPVTILDLDPEIRDSLTTRLGELERDFSNILGDRTDPKAQAAHTMLEKIKEAAAPTEQSVNLNISETALDDLKSLTDELKLEVERNLGKRYDPEANQARFALGQLEGGVKTIQPPHTKVCPARAVMALKEIEPAIAKLRPFQEGTAEQFAQNDAVQNLLFEFEQAMLGQINKGMGRSSAEIAA